MEASIVAKIIDGEVFKNMMIEGAAAVDARKEEINDLMTKAANGPLKGILAVNDEPLVSSDFNHTTVSSTFDATQTRVLKGADGSTLVKVLAWYDNEWGYSCRMLDAARIWMQAK
ncbi:MAG: aldehyde dehydrogenase, partial [Rhodocyclaceae bacterium]|nr:aldehyde dehydrogenase [Rhodocyclaceae bacterium]